MPIPTPETQPYWDGVRPRASCGSSAACDCGEAYFYPRPLCPSCGSGNVEWFTASGRATLYSYVINHRPAPGFEADAPYAIAVVQLAEGPRMMTNLVGVAPTPEALRARHGAAGRVRAARRRLRCRCSRLLEAEDL